ncbi:MAG: methionyl-tRNA formyltransferase [Coriobacteriia bacterium]|nr:methionyl-tRNA formyltransferase [Coriobacteriia bacterium]
MRVVFMGTPPFAVPSLKALAADHDVVAVYTAADRPSGRGLKVTSSAVRCAAEELGLRIEQPSSLRGSAELARLRELRPDVVCVAAYGLILPGDVLTVPAHGSLNVHGSLLPRWRGAAPIERAILAGDAEVGVSIMLMDEGLDTGPYADRLAVPVDGATAEALRQTLAEAGARLLVDVLRRVAGGGVTWVPQDESLASYAPKITAVDVALSPGLTVEEASRRVRASGSSANSRATIDGRTVVVERLTPTSEESTPGSVAASRAGILLGFADGSATLDRLRPSGKSAMDGAEFARGARLGEHAIWGAAL